MENDTLNPSPWHPGELAAQVLTSTREKMAGIGARVIRNYMPGQHREFFARLPMVLLGASDGDGRLWASVLFGEPGFIQSPTPTTMTIEAEINNLDPLAGGLQPGMDIGLLGIELTTRRRNRMNARLDSFSQGRLTLSVRQSFGNCPKYIQLREHRPNANYGIFKKTEFISTDKNLRQRISGADTLFIATRFSDGGDMENRGVDISHRGGRPGFIQIDSAGRLLIPDYPGNNFFNTIGNLIMDPSTGLLIMDFTRGDLIYLHGSTEIVWARDEPLPLANVERMLRFRLEQGIMISNAMPHLWDLREISPSFKSDHRLPAL